MSEHRIEVEVTLKVQVDPHAIFLANDGATITDGEYKDSHYVTGAAGGTPALYVHKKGQVATTAFATAQDIIGALISAAEKAHDIDPLSWR